MASLTSANSILMLGVTSLFSVPQQIQGFSADDIYDIEALEAAETTMGVDGKLSAGFIFNPVKQGISIQSDSPSNDIFDNWYAAQKQARDIYFAFGSIVLPSLSKKFTMPKGVLTTYPPAPDAKKILQPRKYVITWESILPAPM